MGMVFYHRTIFSVTIENYIALDFETEVNIPDGFKY